MADHYDILGVSEHASQDDIRRAYRRLAVRYHPDRNPDPSAAEKIRQINVAYDVLSDPEKRRKYDLSRALPWTEPTATPRPAHRDPAYRRRAQRPRPQPTPPPVNPWLVRYQRFAIVISRVAFAFCVILVIDGILPARQDDEKIVEIVAMTHGHDDSYSMTIRTNFGSKIAFATYSSDAFSEGTIVFLYRTRILAITRRIAADGVIERIPATLFGNFIFLPLILSFTSFLGVLHKNNRQLLNSLGVVNMFLLFLCLLFWLLFR